MLAATSAEVAVLGTGINPPITRPGAVPSRARGALSDTLQRGQRAAFRSIRARHAGHMRSEVSKVGSFDIKVERTADFNFSNLNLSRGGRPIGFRIAHGEKVKP